MSLEKHIAVSERRTEIRRPADGIVRLWPESLDFFTVEGRLKDVTSSGFRAQHQCRELGPGQFTRFEFEGCEGRACVVWNRILGPHVETGFRILQANSPGPTR
jgi:hypothetical protein